MVGLRFTLNMKVDTEHDIPCVEEVSRLLRIIADRLEGGSEFFWDTQDPLTLVDTNGNTVGEAEFVNEEDDG